MMMANKKQADSREVLTSGRYKNSTGILNPFEHGATKILIIGAGGIGSTLAVTLAKMGMYNITVVDFDTVEDHNLQSQFYRVQDLDKFKVDALKEIVLEQSGIEINAINSEFNKTMPLGYDVVFTLVDNNDTRREIVESCRGVPHIIDCRMGGTMFEICHFSFDTRDEWIDNFWFPESEAAPVECSAKSSCFNCFAVAGFAGSVFRSRILSRPMAKIMKMDVANMFLIAD